MGVSVSSLVSVQRALTRYGMSSYVTLGNVGHLFTIAVFSQRDHRRNPCSLYLLAMTVCNLICLDVGIIPIIFSLDHADLSNQSLVACKLQFYIRHAFFQLMRTYKVLACLDRFTLCTLSARIRSFSSHRMASRLIVLSALFWLLLVIYFGWMRSIENGSCAIFDSTASLIYTIYYLIFAGLVPPLLISTFTMLAMHRLQQLRRRVQPLAENADRTGSTNVIRKRDRDLMRMVFAEVIVYVVTTMPFSIFLLYKLFTDNLKKSRDRSQIESFVNYLLQSFIMYLNTALPFYIFCITSPSFRRQCRRVTNRVYYFIRRQPMPERMDDNARTMTIQHGLRSN